MNMLHENGDKDEQKTFLLDQYSRYFWNYLYPALC